MSDVERLAQQVSDTVKDYRKVFPEPHSLAPNLALAVEAVEQVRELQAENERLRENRDAAIQAGLDATDIIAAERDAAIERAEVAEAAIERVKALLPKWEQHYGDDSIDGEIKELRAALDGDPS